MVQQLHHQQPLSEEQFSWFQEQFLQLSGSHIPNFKKNLVVSRLYKRLQELGMIEWETYIDYLKAHPDSEQRHFINALTTNKTHFFREREHFSLIEAHLLRQRSHCDLFLWVPGCSTGQDPYSLAITIAEFNRKNQSQLRPHILATDIDTDVLRIAESGVYNRENTAKEVTPDLLTQYFSKEGGAGNDLKVEKQRLGDIKFRQHNICTSLDTGLSFDLIMIRNTLIYFKPVQRDLIIRNLLARLHIGGLLILGHCETLTDLPRGLNHLERSVYVKVGP